MDILFLYPAKAYLVEATRKARLLEHEGRTFAAFANVKIYVGTGENPRFAYQESEGCNTYVVQVSDDVFVYLDYVDNAASFLKRQSLRNKAFIAGIISRAKEVLVDMEGYNACLSAVMAERHAAQKAATEKAKSEETAQLEAEALFKAGGFISWPAFETACHNYGVRLGSPTKGAGRKRVICIGPGSSKHSGNGRLSRGVLQAVKALNTAMLEGV